MKPSSWDRQLGLALPLECAAGQSNQTNNPSKNEVGLDVRHHTPHLPEGRGDAFFLTSSFIARHSRNQNSRKLSLSAVGNRFSQKPHRSRILKSHSSSGAGLTQDLKAFPVCVSLQVHSKTQKRYGV